MSEGVCVNYVTIWRREKQTYQRNLHELVRKKLVNLTNRYSTRFVAPDAVRGIVVEEQEVPVEFSTEPRCYGDVVLDTNERNALSLPPKYAVHAKLDVVDCEAQVEKGLAKLRWSIKESEREDAVGRPIVSGAFKTGTNSLDFSLMRATDLPFNQRISLPDRVDDATEVKMFTLKERLKEVTEEVRSQLDLERSGNLSVSQREVSHHFQGECVRTISLYFRRINPGGLQWIRQTTTVKQLSLILYVT